MGIQSLLEHVGVLKAGQQWYFKEEEKVAEELNREGKVIPALGRSVMYTLTEHDAQEINKRRADFQKWRGDTRYEDSGLQAHVGNTAQRGDYFPATVVAMFPKEDDHLLNLRVLLDGTDVFWATSRERGLSAGQWHFHFEAK